MNRNLLYIASAATLVLALSACTKEQVVQQEGDKSPIELSVGVADDGFATKAVITDGTGKTARAFTGATNLFFAVYAENAAGSAHKYGFNYGTAEAVSSPAVGSTSTVSFPSNYLYWDDAYARDSKVSIYSIAVSNKQRGYVTLSANGTAVNVGSESPGASVVAFDTGKSNNITCTWSLGLEGDTETGTQNSETFSWQDLVFSNNIAFHSSTDDDRLLFDTSNKKFAQGNLIYYHALSQITVYIKCGDGFKGDGTDFSFTSTPTNRDNSFAMNGFYGRSATFNVNDGEFGTLSDANKRTYTSIYLANTTHQKANSGSYYELHAYVIPGTDMTANAVSDMFAFTIDNNKYELSQQALYDAIKNGTTNVAKKGSNPSDVDTSILGGGKTLLAGVNYAFTFTVDKSKVKDITAQVVDWENVEAQNVNPKANSIAVTTQVVSSNASAATSFDLYRLPYVSSADAIDLNIKNYDWAGRYTDKAVLTGPTSNVWGTSNWYFESNKHFYHFRAVSPKAATQEGTTVKTGTSPDDDYLELTSAAVTTSPVASYTDVLWGAPFLAPTGDNDKYSYSATYGFDGAKAGDATPTHQIHHGIVTTESTINLLMFHMMSDVKFNITTTAGTATDKVTLQTTSGGNTVNTKVELIGYYQSGKVLMGNGKTETTGSATTADAAVGITMDTYTAESGENAAKCVFHYGAVPQSLENVVLRITTPDNNQYKVSMKDVVSTTPTYNNVTYPYTDNKVNWWYPGVKYTYTFKLSKTKIENITATLVDWENVSAGDDHVQIQ